MTASLTQQDRAEQAIKLSERLLEELEACVRGYEEASLQVDRLLNHESDGVSVEPVLVLALTLMNQARVVLADLKNEAVWS